MRTSQNTSKPQQHLNMADPATIVLGGEAPSINVDFATSYELTVQPPQSNFSVEVASSNVQSIEVAGNSLSIDLPAQRQVVPTTVNTETISVEVSNRVQAIGSTVKRLRDLEDIVGDPESGQILFYNSGQNNFQFRDNQGAGSGESDENINSPIQVTNTDGAFSTLVGQTIETGTSVTSVLSSILNPYTKTSVQLTFLEGSKEGVAFSVSAGSTELLEVGTSISLQNFSFTVGDASKVKDGSIKLMKNSDAHMSALSDSGGTNVSLSPSISSQKNTPGTDVYKITAVDSGNPNGLEYDLTSSSMSIAWKHRIGLYAHSTNPTNNSSATTVFGHGIDARLLDDPGSSSVAFTCGAANASDSNYSYLMWPVSFGTLKAVDQNGAADVTADFSLIGSYTVTSSKGVSVNYYIYGTNDTGAFNENVVLNVTLQDA